MRIKRNVVIFLSCCKVGCAVHGTILCTQTFVNSTMNLIIKNRIISPKYKYDWVSVFFFYLGKIVNKVINKVSDLQIRYGKLNTFFLILLTFISFLVLVAAYFLYRSVWFYDLYAQYGTVIFTQKSIVKRAIVGSKIESRILL